MVILLPQLYAGTKDMTDHSCLFHFLNELKGKERCGNQKGAWKERRAYETVL